MINKAQFHRYLLSCTLYLIGFAVTEAAEAVATPQSQIAILNRQSPVEPSSALGITGASMGLSVRRVTFDQSAPQRQGGDSAFAPGFHFIKGLWYPVDIGYSFSYIDEVSATLQSVFTQIELVPGIRWPSVSLRAGFHSLDSYDWHSAKSVDAAVMTTIHGIPWTALYGAIGGAAHQIATDEKTGLYYDNFYTLGAKFKYPTPFVGWAIEWTRWPISDESEIKIKTSFNI